MAPDSITNALSVDVEDYFHVSAFEGVLDPSAWDQMEPRVEENTHRLLRRFSEQRVRATFFVLGWVAERYVGLVRRIRDLGHEVASHGYNHRRVTSMTSEDFRQDARRSKAILEDITGEPVLGYRAPSFSITEQTLWALDILSEEGYRYDSSIFPIRHDRYGIPAAPRFAWRPRTIGQNELHEFPISTLRLLGQNLPFIGGGYLRHFPWWYIEWGVKRVNSQEKRPVVMYLHPWEIDPAQPRIEAGFLTSIRHYRNLDKTEDRLERLIRRFEFAPLRTVLEL